MPLNHKRSYGIAISPEGVKEWDTLTCCHCQRIIHIVPKEPIPGGFCVKCNKNTCEACHQVGTCRPFEKWLDEVEKKASRESRLGI